MVAPVGRVGSVLGRMMIKLGKHDGFKTINVVRAARRWPNWRRVGRMPSSASSEGRSIDAQVRKKSSVPTAAKYARSIPWGETGTGVFQSLAADGRMIVYGDTLAATVAD